MLTVFVAAAGSCGGQHDGSSNRLGATGLEEAYWAPTPAVLDLLQPDGPQQLPQHPEFNKDGEHGWCWGNHPDASVSDYNAFKRAVIECKPAFAYSMTDLTGYKGSLGDADIEMLSTDKIWSSPRRYSSLEMEVQEEKCKELLAAGFIQKAPVGTSYASCPTMAAKRDLDGNWTEKRFCIDLRKINESCKSHATKPPLPEELFLRLAGCKVFSTLDLKSGFHQILLTERSREYTNFWWDKELWQYTRLLFGLKTATSLFQERIDDTLRRHGLTNVAFSYVDDVLIASRNMQEHTKAVQAVLRALEADGWKVHPGKSMFGARSVQYLGHLVTPDGIQPSQAKTSAIMQLPAPRDVSELRSVLGVLNFYRCYLPSFSITAGPMNKLLEKNYTFAWEDEQQAAFNILRGELAKPGVGLRQPDPDKPFYVHTDWSQHGIAGMLSQLNDAGEPYLVACTSRSLNKHERNYPAYKGEILACVYAVKQFRPYLHGRKFHLVTDHRPLIYLMQTKEPAGQQLRWILSLMEHDFTIQHIEGKLNPADAPSRTPVPRSFDNTGARQHADEDPLSPPLPQVHLPDGSLLQHMPPQEELAEVIGANIKASVRKKKKGKGDSGADKYEEYDSGVEFEDGSVPYSVAAACLTMPTYAERANTWASKSKADYQILMAMQQPSGCEKHGVGISVDSIPTGADILWRDESHMHTGWDCMKDALTSHQVLQQNLGAVAREWVQGALNRPPPNVTPSETNRPTHPDGLLTHSILPALHAAQQCGEGIVVLDLFGGLGAGLEMALRNGFKVQHYIHIDIDPVARNVARSRAEQFLDRFPGQLDRESITHMHDMLAHDVNKITAADLARVSKGLGGQWLVVAGWPCQDLSRAGKQKGLDGERSALFYPMIELLTHLQHVQSERPPAYLLENVAFLNDTDSSKQAYEIICDFLGHPHVLDAAQFGSFAHRLRYFWTNMVSPIHLYAALRQVTRQQDLQVQHIMQPGRHCQPVKTLHPTESGYYQANMYGLNRSCWPTLMAYPGSRAFLPGEAGAVWCQGTEGKGYWDEPSAVERERAMGFMEGDTAAYGVTEADRRKLLGNAMDMNTLQCIMAAALAWGPHMRIGVHSSANATHSASSVRTIPDVQHWEGISFAACTAQLGISPIDPSAPTHPPTAAVLPPSGGGVVGRVQPTSALTLQQQRTAAEDLIQCCAVAGMAELREGGKDIWLDAAVLQYLQHSSHVAGSSEQEKRRVRKRAKGYAWQNGKLTRSMADGEDREVPTLDKRAEIVKQYHGKGHLGVRRTTALVANSYYWHGMMTDVNLYVRQCDLCQRSRASFNVERPVLQPLPMVGLGYRWHCDLFGPIKHAEPHGNTYVMVCVESYSRWIEAIPIKSKHARHTAQAFLQSVIARWGAPAEVVTDQGAEFEGEFDQLMQQCLIDHRRTSGYHPQANGAAERVVQTIKRSLQKLVEEHGDPTAWERLMAWAVLAYRAAPQEASRLSPYELVFAKKPVIPPATWSETVQPVGLDLAEGDVKKLVAELMRRQARYQHLAPMATANKAIAQHRDMQWYAQRRSGNYLPRLYTFHAGDLVYCEARTGDALQTKASPIILRITEVRDTGVLILQGRDGKLKAVHSSQVAPCHLAGIDTTLDAELQYTTGAEKCQICHSPEDEATMVMCDNCFTGWHMACLTPAMKVVPKGVFVCPRCSKAGFTLQQVAAKAAVRHEQDMRLQQIKQNFPAPAAKKARSKAARLDGRLCQRWLPTALQIPQWEYSRLHFRGVNSGPKQLLLISQDGDYEHLSYGALEKRIDSGFIRLLDRKDVLPKGVQIPLPNQLHA